MIITNNNHKFYNDTYNYISIKNNLIFGEIPFYYAKDNHDVLVVTKTYYKQIIEKLKEIINEY